MIKVWYDWAALTTIPVLESVSPTEACPFRFVVDISDKQERWSMDVHGSNFFISPTSRNDTLYAPYGSSILSHDPRPPLIRPSFIFALFIIFRTSLSFLPSPVCNEQSKRPFPFPSLPVVTVIVATNYCCFVLCSSLRYMRHALFPSQFSHRTAAACDCERRTPLFSAGLGRPIM